jgi:hypothetical protein
MRRDNAHTQEAAMGKAGTLHALDVGPTDYGAAANSNRARDADSAAECCYVLNTRRFQ